MADYDLYYWSVPFRGQFVRALLGFAGRSWNEPGDAATEQLMQRPAREMPVPFMGPPVLVDHRASFALAQMPAIILYLGETLNLLPATPALRAMTMKIVNDANDVLDDLTLDGGRYVMWTPQSWKEFVPRLEKWMSFWEVTGTRHGLQASSGFLLGSDGPGVADVVSATLWGTMVAHLPKLGEMLRQTAPRVAALTERVSALPALAAVAARARQEYGEVYCSGQIEEALRKVLS